MTTPVYKTATHALVAGAAPTDYGTLAPPQQFDFLDVLVDPGGQDGTLVVEVIAQPAINAVIIGTVDITNPALYGIGGTLDGKTLELQFDNNIPILLTFSGGTTSLNEANMLAVIIATYPGITAVQGGPGGNKLVLTDTVLGQSITVINPLVPSAAPILGLALGLTGAGVKFTASKVTIRGGQPTIAIPQIEVIGSIIYDLHVSSPDTNFAAVKCTMSGYNRQAGVIDEIVDKSVALVRGVEVSFGVLNNYHTYVQASVDFGASPGGSEAIWRLYGTGDVANGGVRVLISQLRVAPGANGLGAGQLVIQLPEQFPVHFTRDQSDDFRTIGVQKYELTAEAVNIFDPTVNTPPHATLIGFDPACSCIPDSDGVITNPQLIWFVDPQNISGVASDSNNGLTAQTPVLTISHVTGTWGTTEPDFGSEAVTVTINLLSNTNATDPVNITPKQGTVVVVAPLTQVATGSISPGGVIPRNQATAQKWEIVTTSFPSWAPFINDWVQDTTTPSWFTVESEPVAGTAVVTQPAIDSRSSAGTVLPTLVTPVALDNFIVWRPGIVHVSVAGSLAPNGALIIQNALITPVVVGGQSDFYGGIVLQQCVSNAYVSVASQLEGNGPASIDNAKPFFSNCVFLKGIESESHTLYGGSVWAPFVLRAAGVQSIYGGGIYFNAPSGIQSFSSPGKHQFGDCAFFCTNLNLLGAGNGRQGSGVVDTGTDNVPGTTPAAWGASAWPIHSAGIHMCKTSFTLELKVTGVITLAGLTTASSFNPTTGAYSPQIGAGSVGFVGGLTPAAIDAAGPGIAVQGGGVFAPGNMCGMFKEF